MLHVAHLILAGSSSGLEQLGNSSLAQLCRACTEAARRIVRTIITLRSMNLLGKIPESVVGAEIRAKSTDL
jgi:proline utilization trans-activator